MVSEGGDGDCVQGGRRKDRGDNEGGCESMIDLVSRHVNVCSNMAQTCRVVLFGAGTKGAQLRSTTAGPAKNNSPGKVTCSFVWGEAWEG